MKTYFYDVFKFEYFLMVISILIVSFTTMSFFYLSNVNAQNTPGEVDKLTNQGITLASSGNYTEAIETFDKALSIDPNNIRAIINKYDALRNLDNYTELLYHLAYVF